MSQPTTDRRAAFVARRLDALVALVRHQPYSDTPTLLSLAEHDAELGGLTSTRLGDMLQELFDSERINRRGSGRHACWYTSGADAVLAERQREREATGQVERVSVPTPPAPTSKAAPTTSTDGRQLARLAATTPKIEGAGLVVGIDGAAPGDVVADIGPGESVLDVAPHQTGESFEATMADLVARGLMQRVKPTTPPSASRNGRADPESGTGRMVAYIFAHPYCVSGDIVRDLGLTHSIVSTSLKTHADACREPRISRAMGDDGLYRWFPTASPDVGAEQLHVNRATNGTHPRKGVRSDEVDPDSATGRCAAWVVANPGRTAREVGNALGIQASKAATLLALHCGTGRKPRITRTQVDGIYTYSGAEQAGGVNMSPETNDSEQSNTQATDGVGLETAPGSSGVVAPRGVVGVDPSEVAQVASDAPPATLMGLDWLPPQLAFLGLCAPIKLFRGASQMFGKTTAALWETLALMMGANPYQPGRTVHHATIVVGSWAQSLSVQRKFHDLIPAGWLHENCCYDRARGFKGSTPACVLRNGSIVRFKSQRGAFVLAASTTTHIYFDTVPLSAHLFDAARRRMEELGGTIALCHATTEGTPRWLFSEVTALRIAEVHAVACVENLTHASGRPWRMDDAQQDVIDYVREVRAAGGPTVGIDLDAYWPRDFMAERPGSTDESGVLPPEASVESDDGAGPSEAVPTASEAPSEDLHLVADLTKRVMELEVQRDALLRANETQERVRTTLQSEISDARDWLSKLTYIGADTPIDIAAKRAVDAVRVRESAKALAVAEQASYAAYIDAARVRVLRLLGSQVDVEDQGASLDELLTSLEARVHGLEASYDSGLDRATADRAELTRLVRFLERETRKPREGETPVETAIRFMLEDAHRLRMVAHLAVGGEVARG